MTESTKSLGLYGLNFSIIKRYKHKSGCGTSC